jgi:Holliday junction resolvase RusA-like endonuclease
MRIKIVIDGQPTAKARARTRRVKGKTTTYDPQVDEKTTFRWRLRSALSRCDDIAGLFLRRIEVTIAYEMSLPLSMGKTERSRLLGTGHAKRPDLDNLAKFTLDAANGVLWRDDAQIESLNLRKYWGYEPRTIIIVDYLTNGEANANEKGTLT